MLLTRDRGFYRSLFALSLPIALQNLITFSVGLADNVMIGALGDTAVSGVYVGNQVQTLLQVFSGGIEGAILIPAAQYWGKRDTESIRRIVAIGMRLSLLFGGLLTLVCALFPSWILSLFSRDGSVVAAGAEYLGTVCFSFAFFCLTQAMIAAMRSVEAARVGLYVSLCSLGLNVALNYLLIFGKGPFPALGVQGAAIATLIARIAEAVIVTVYVLAVDRRLQLRLRHLFKTDRALFRDFVRYGAPVVGGQLVWAANLLIGAAILGTFTKEVLAAVSVTGTMNNLCYVVMNGMAGAVGIITGKTIGEGDIPRMKEYARTVQVIFLALGLVTSGALWLAMEPFLSLYGISPQAAGYARGLLRVLSVTIVGTCYQCACLFGLVKSGGDVSFVFKNDAIFVFLIVLPSAYVAMRLGAPPWVVFALLKCDQLLKCIVAAIKINRFRWIKPLTRAAQGAAG